ncbi:MAG: ligand-gated ion channel [Planctomycetota bacterium]
MEKTEEKATEKAELKTKRPEEWGETTKIHFHVFVLDIDNIDGASQSFTANAYVFLRWTDKRLAHEGSVRTIPLEETWNPRVIIANRGGLMQKSLPEVVEIESDGTVTYRQRFIGPLILKIWLHTCPTQKTNLFYFKELCKLPERLSRLFV